MKNLLPLLILVVFSGAFLSGCVESREYRYVDPYDSDNYLTLNAIDKTFTVVTKDFVAGGRYTETSEAYTLWYGECPVGVTLIKTTNGIIIDDGVEWKKEPVV